MIDARVRLDFSGGRNFGNALSTFGSSGSGGGPAMNALRKSWAARYSKFARKRYAAQSRGGGDWPDLAPSTKKQRRGPASSRRPKRGRRNQLSARTTTRGGGRVFAILRDTDTLYNALTIGAAGNLIAGIPAGVRFGFGGPARHEGGVSIAQLAAIHQEGNPANNLPARSIIVEPDRQTVQLMIGDLRRVLNRKW